MKRLFLIAGSFMLTSAALIVQGATNRSEVPTLPKTWQLDFQFHDPQKLVLSTPAGEEVYWYFLYEVTNRTGQDVNFLPSFELVTNTTDVVVGGDRVNPRVYDVISARYKSEFPFMVSPRKATGLLLQGEENKRASVAIFGPFDFSARSFEIFVAGLSGDVTRTPNPTFDTSKPASDSNPREFIFRRTLAIAYNIPGDSSTTQSADPVRLTRCWVMR